MMRMVSVVEAEIEPRDFGAFFERERVRLLRATLLLTGNVAEAQDLAQEALARVLERWDRVCTMDSPDGYLYRTALNLNRERLRRLAVATRRALAAGGQDELAAAEDASTCSAPSRHFRGRSAKPSCSSRLGFTADEAGELLGIEPVSVRGRLHRAREGLRRHLGGGDA